MECFFSVIVPIYKVESFLPQCIESVLMQEFHNYELILVEDGSLDKCPLICDDYALKDDKIRVIHKPNGGLSDARNAGLKVSSGTYIVFLDGDDYLAKNSLNNAYHLLLEYKMPDILISAYRSIYPDKSTKLNKYKLTEVGKEISHYTDLLHSCITETREIPWAVWRSIFKREVLEKNKVSFDKYLYAAEDSDFFMKYIPYVKSYVIMDSPLINYRKSREGSLSNSINFKKMICLLTVFGEQFYAYKGYAQDKKNRVISIHFAEKFCNIIYELHYLTDMEEVQQAENLIDENNEILKYAKRLKYTAAKILWKIFGYYKGSQIMYKIRKWLS